MSGATDGEERIGTNSGHGHVWPRPDGTRMRCGGLGLCAQCGRDAAIVEAARTRKKRAKKATLATLKSERDAALERVAVLEKELDETVKMMRGLIAERDNEIASLMALKEITHD